MSYLCFLKKQAILFIFLGVQTKLSAMDDCSLSSKPPLLVRSLSVPNFPNLIAHRLACCEKRIERLLQRINAKREEWRRQAPSIAPKELRLKKYIFGREVRALEQQIEQLESVMSSFESVLLVD